MLRRWFTTDEHAVYRHLSKMRFRDEKVSHRKRQYVVGKTRVPTIESYGSLIKRNDRELSSRLGCLSATVSE